MRGGGWRLGGGGRSGGSFARTLGWVLVVGVASRRQGLPERASSCRRGGPRRRQENETSKVRSRECARAPSVLGRRASTLRPAAAAGTRARASDAPRRSAPMSTGPGPSGAPTRPQVTPPAAALVRVAAGRSSSPSSGKHSGHCPRALKLGSRAFM